MMDPTALRHQLLAAGFCPLPLRGKAPFQKDWQKRTAPSSADIDNWSLHYPDAGNTGSLTRLMPTLDTDITDEKAAEAVENLVREKFEKRGCILVRIGSAPKRAIPFRTHTPFPKIVGKIIAPDGGTDQKIEMLCDGQQVVVDGIHPDTKKPYGWHGGAPGAVSAEELPCIDAEEAQALVDDAVELLVRNFGYTRPHAKQRAGNGFDQQRTDWAEEISNILIGSELHDSITRLAAKLITSGMSAGAATNFLRDLLQRSSAPRDARFDTRMTDDIRRAVDSALRKYQPANEPPHPASGTSRDQSPRRSRVAAASTALPELVINESDPTATAKELAGLFAARSNFLFNGNTPVRIAIEGDSLPRALEVTPEAVRVYAHTLCRPVKITKTKAKAGAAPTPAPLSKDIAALYLNGLEGEWGLRSFRGITTAPILRGDGNIRDADGFDQETGLWCHAIPALDIPERPTKTDAQAALLYLRQFFQTFPYADAARIADHELGVETVDLNKPVGLDESTFLAALLTAVCRQSLELAPAYLVRAPKFSGAGTGKGLAVKAVCIIGSGVRPAAFTSGHDREEFDKRLTAALIEARPAIFLDNFNAKELKSDILSSVLTESPAMVRPMGQSKTVPLNTRASIGITGNAVEVAEDMARRIIATNFDAHMESPEQRKFRPGFLDQVFANRNRLLSAALTIWRWGRQNKLEHGKPLGSYELWGEWCRDPLLALGCRDPVDRVDEIKAADPHRRTLVEVFDTWRDKHGDSTIKAKDLDPEVIELIDPRASWKNDKLQFNRQRVARFLAAHTDTRVGGYLLEQKKADTTRQLASYTLHREEKP
jgi:hypothetical protein